MIQALGDPSSSTVVRAKDGVPLPEDGPLGRSKEFMGGFYLIDVDSKERAIDLARQIPDTEIDGLAVEIRPVTYSAWPADGAVHPVRRPGGRGGAG